ncbi:ATP-binding protein [Bacillus sp. AK128]
MKMKSKRIKLIIVLSIMLVFLFTAINIYTSYSNIQQSVEESIARKSLENAKSIAASMDVKEYKEFLANPEMDERYWEIRSYLNDAREKIGALYVYTLKIDNPKISYGMIVGMPEDADDEYPIGLVCTLPEKQVQLAYRGESYFTSILDDATYGVSYISVGVPIFDENKEIIGYLGIDISSEVLDDIGNKVLANSIPTLVFNGVFVLLLLLAFIAIQKWYQRELKLEIGDTEDTYYKESQTLLSSVQSLRHDFINHIQVLHGLLKLGNHKQAYEYVTHLFNEAQTVSPATLKINNPVLSVLFQTKKLAAQNRGIQINFEISHDTFDKIKTTDLIKILSNLMDNAIEATELLPEKERNVSIRCTIDGNHYVVEVKNTGQKIEEKDLEKVFMRGFSTKHATPNQVRGQGLPIIKEIVKKYGGKISFDSTEQHTTVTVRIPIEP